LSTRSSSLPGPLRIDLRPSLYLRLALIALGALLLAAIVQTALPWSSRCALAVAVSLYLYLLLRCHTGLWAPPACTGLLWDGAVWFWLDGGGQQPVVLQQAALWPGLIALEFRRAGSRRRCALLLLPDSADADAQRRLRIYLRHLPVFGA
jgi:hypothetical protein